MRPRLGDRNSRACDKRSQIEPFVIFCVHQRDEVVAQNPDLNCGQITSVLGAMWRALPMEGKQEYVALARSEAAHPTPPRKRQRPVAAPQRPPAIDPGLAVGPSSSPEETEQPPSFHAIPHLWVVPRGRFGLCAANVSQSAFAVEAGPDVNAAP